MQGRRAGYARPCAARDHLDSRRLAARRRYDRCAANHFSGPRLFGGRTAQKTASRQASSVAHTRGAPRGRAVPSGLPRVGGVAPAQPHTTPGPTRGAAASHAYRSQRALHSHSKLSNPCRCPYPQKKPTPTTGSNEFRVAALPCGRAARPRRGGVQQCNDESSESAGSDGSRAGE